MLLQWTAKTAAYVAYEAIRKNMDKENKSKMTLVRNDPMLEARACLPEVLFDTLEHYQKCLTSLVNDTLLKSDQKLLELLSNTHLRAEIDSYNYTLTQLRQHRTHCVIRFKEHLVEQFAALCENGSQHEPQHDRLQNNQADNNPTKRHKTHAPDWDVISNTELDLVLSSEAIARRTHANKALPIDAIHSCFEQSLKHDIALSELPIGPLAILRCLLEAGREAKLDDLGIMVLVETAENTLLEKLADSYETTLKLFASEGIRPKPKVIPKKASEKNKKKSRVFEVIEGKDGQITIGSSGAGTGAVYGNRGASTPNQGLGSVGGSAGLANQQMGVGGNAPQLPENVLSTILPMVDKVAEKTFEKTHHYHKTVDTLMRVLDKQRLLEKLSTSHTQGLGTVKETFAQLQAAKELSDSTHDLLDTLLPTFVKATLQEPVFLNQEESDGRELINLIAAMDFYWHGDESNQSIERARATVDKLTHTEKVSKEAFQDAVTEIKTLYKEENRKTQMIEKRITAAEQGKAKTNQIKAQVFEEISGVISHYRVEKDLSYLMQNAWRQVMFYDGLKFGLESEEWQSDVKTLVRLGKTNHYASLWRNQSRLQAFLKSLFVNIKHNLARIGINGFKLEKLTQSFFSAFEKLKKNRILAKERKQAEKQIIPKESVRTENQAKDIQSSKNAQKEMSSNDPNISKAYWRIEKFERGQEFDLSIDGNIKRCRLAAIIDQTRTYIFVNYRGCKVAEHTCDALARQIASGNAVPVECEGLFDRILEKIISQRPHQDMPPVCC